MSYVESQRRKTFDTVADTVLPAVCRPLMPKKKQRYRKTTTAALIW